ncbi:MarP family serine protease [Gandjariella thermophila]|uniref:Serine protease n=1 Tax=Gandjariella thermophila TaxID=1931992 RepID=A0A4D4J887_9PSEU|nr:MarP family serine protease [Gandjariella thermophila]GDY30726.1 serine protease [Gandjariella thermophila]
MNWVDLLVITLAVLAAVSGARQGMVTALPAFAGVLGGAILGVRVAPLVVDQFSSVATRVSFAVAIVVLLVALGETLGVYVGRAIKRHVNRTPLTGVDNALGAVVQGAVVFVVAWLIALPLTSVVGLPGLAGAINRSAVLGTVNSMMPAEAQQLPGELRQLLDVSGFPAAIDPFARTPIADVSPPDTALQNSAVVNRVRPSVLKVRGRAPSCSRALEGSGFVIAPQRVMTNAHVVAGTDEALVEVGRGELEARVVYYDPEVDVAVLAVPDLTAAPLTFDDRAATSGENAVVLGYPLDGPYTASPARVRERIQLRGPDIYDARTVTRDVYTVRATVRSGNSGGPLIDPQGRVLGVVFGAAVDDPETGFVLTARQVAAAASAASDLNRKVSTGSCAT